MMDSRIIPVIQEATPRLTPSPIRALSFHKLPLRGDVGAVGHTPAQGGESIEGGLLDGGFAERGHGGPNAAGTFRGFSGSRAQFTGLSRIYCSILPRGLSSRTMCS